ncbi:hypothetical protein BpHYR1_002853 [Brachionus plicatilis]|uniref:Uncharacterized protein n=1 Tax=Brachionus plicatilis TaxID=10195 RepID=A0A3M7QXD9_BRAPC|nr:hypothetical protein BpHYR1_002853 [Brachionus plicatilis]
MEDKKTGKLGGKKSFFDSIDSMEAIIYVQYNLKLTCTFLFLNYSLTLPFPTGIVEEESTSNRELIACEAYIRSDIYGNCFAGSADQFSLNR